LIAFNGSEDRRGSMAEEEEWQTARLFFDTARKPGGGEEARRMMRRGKSRCLLARLSDASAENLAKYKRTAECPHTLRACKI
jgi:hypothetical protein